MLPLITFLIIYITTGLLSSDFESIPLLIGIIIAVAIALILNKEKGEKLSSDKKIAIFAKGAGEETLILMIVIFMLAGAFYGTAALVSGSYDYQLVEIIPYLLVIILSIVGWNVISVLSMGILSGMVVGLINGRFTLIEFMKIIHEGMVSMQDIAMISLFVGGLVALKTHLGGIDWLLHTLTKNMKTQRGAEFSIAALVSLMDIATTNNTISIITAGP